MKEIKLELKVEDVNMILSALGNLPFIQVHELIGRIQIQASKQLSTSVNGEAIKINDRELEKTNSNAG